MQLSFVVRRDRNEDGMVEVVIRGKNEISEIKEDGRRMVGRRMEDGRCWFWASMMDFGGLWEQDMTLLGMIERQLYSKPHFTHALQIMSLFISFFSWKDFNFYN